MRIEATPLKDCYLVHPTLFEDERGYFFESFNRKVFAEKTSLQVDFVQDNQAKSDYGVLRGLHFQKGELAQAKLVRILQGKVLDVVVDMREGSSTYLQTFSVELSAENFVQLFVPRGFAHGYSVLEDDTIFFYKCDNYYDKASEGGVHYADPTLNINWKVPSEKMIISDKDQILPNLS